MDTNKIESAVFGGGCFWCTEAVFGELRGVVSAMPGYTGGTVPHPTYEQVCAGTTGHAEATRIEFDPSQISFNDLLTVFFATHDPTTRNRQGNDVGPQYRSAVFYTTPEQKAEAEQFIADIAAKDPNGRPIVTEIVPFDVFYEAEDYHRQYFKKHPNAGYCQLIIEPKVEKLQKQFAELLKTHQRVVSSGGATAGIKSDEQLKKESPNLYHIAREGGTEPAFKGRYWNEHAKGMYKCAVCGTELFSSETKFDSGTGWPSFTEPANREHIELRPDTAYGMNRTEVVCKMCGAHLGHLFDDGPEDKGGKRYCINSVCLELEKEGENGEGQ